MPRIRRDLVTSLLLMAAFTALAGCPSSPTARQGFVTDHQGRALFLRGFNMDDSTTYGPVTPGALSRADFQLLAAHGFDFVRMVLFWNGLEHERGVYSEDYLSRISQMLDWAEEAHLWVMLDFHQDQYNTQFTGRGFPDWTVRDDGEPFFPWPWPFQSLTPAVRRCYDHFWNDEDLQQAYEDAFMVVVSRFQDRANVIGYDLMNEPFNGDLPLPDF